VCQYFTDTIVQHPFSDPEDDGEGGRDFETVQEAHTLVKRMHRYCPKLLLNVIPQLQEEMSVDNIQIRLLATQTLGEMFSHKQYGSELMRDYRTTWVQWIARKNDKTPAVRLTFVEGAKKLIGNVDMRADVDGELCPL
jgi:sister chromatid cohesion protein PDS5